LQHSLEESVGTLHGRLSVDGTYRSGADVILTKQEYQRDIDDRKKSFLAIVQKVLPVFGSEPREALLQNLKHIARERLGAHISELERKLREHAERLGFANFPDLDLGAPRVLLAIDAELEILLRSPAQSTESVPKLPGLIDGARLDELRSLSTDKFDLSRLIRLCEEANSCYKNECLHAVVMLTRAILDHIPPIFGRQTFADVANQYRGGKSFHQIAEHLEKSARKIADLHLHLHIRSCEVLPTRTQVNFGPELDVVLGEVVRTLK